jgi:serpin B
MKPFLLASAALLCLGGCGGNTDEEAKPAGLTPPTEAQLKAAADLKIPRDKFAFSLKDRLLKEHPNENLCYSPLSIQLCLSMLLNGTAGDSSEQVRAALALDKEPLDLVNDGSYALVAALLEGPFTCANSIWLPTKDTPKPQFRTAIQDAYRGAFFPVNDFGPGTVKRINDWTSANTKQRIPELFKTLEADTSAVLVNALTFDGKWSHPFEKANTEPKPFTLPDGKSVQVPTMQQARQFAFGELNGSKLLRMTYSGEKFSMVFILPPEKQSTQAYLTKLTLTDFAKGINALRGTKVDVAIPKFELTSSYSLNETLSSMGMAKMFEHADLSNMVDGPQGQTYISKVVHKTFMKVYEEGTEAAAATGAVAATAAGPSEAAPPTFHADRPFVYALVHNSTGTIVFLGVVADPLG